MSFAFEQENTATIPVLSTPPDLIRTGFVAPVKEKLRPVHAVEAIQKNYYRDEWDSKKIGINNLYGTHMAARMQMERTILAQFQRLPELPTSFVGLETVLGTDEDIQFEDFLADPREAEHVRIPETAYNKWFV